MTINVYGFQRSLTEAKWSKLDMLGKRAAWHEGVASGFNVTAGSGLSVSVSSGDAFVPGLLVESDSSASVALTAGTGTRVDYLILEANWGTSNSSLGTAPHAAALKVKTGTANTPPALTQTPGVLWQMPLRRLIPSATSITTANIQPAAPQPRRPVVTVAPAWAQQDVNTTGNPFLASLTLGDLGWPYIIRAEAVMRISGDTGYGVATVLVNGAEFGTAMSSGMDTTNGRQILNLTAASDVMTGPKTVNLRASYSSAQSGVMTVYGGTGVQYFRVWQIPA